MAKDKRPQRPDRGAMTPVPPPAAPSPPEQLLTRQQAAELAGKEFFAVSPRTIERWPLAWCRINGRAYCRADDLRQFLRARVAASLWLRGGGKGGPKAPSGDDD